MTTTELIKILKQNELGGITHKPREISLNVNGNFISNPTFLVSCTGDGICGAEITLDIEGNKLGKMTNCDRIKAMSIEEMAEFLGETISGCPRHTEVCEVNATCTDCFKQYLESEVDTDEK